MDNESYATTRRLIKKPPADLGSASGTLGNWLKTPENTGKMAEGGLRLGGFFKEASSINPLITVITVVYNDVAFLEESIKSVIGQTYDNIEYIVIDGGSKDGTLEIIQQYEHAIDYWVSEKDEGIYDAMNKGIKIASVNSWLLFVGADDIVVDLDCIASVVKMDCSVGCIVANVSQMARGANKVAKYRCWLPESRYMEDDFLRFPLHHQGFLFKKTRENIFFKGEIGIHSDYDQMLRALEHLKGRYINRVVTCYRTGGASDKFGLESIMSLIRVARSNEIDVFRIVSKNKLISLKILLKASIPYGILLRFRSLRVMFVPR